VTVLITKRSVKRAEIKLVIARSRDRRGEKEYEKFEIKIFIMSIARTTIEGIKIAHVSPSLVSPHAS